MKAEWTNADVIATSPISGGSSISSSVREQTLEERNGYLQDENSRLISEIQKLRSDNTMLKETIVRLTMKLVGETQ